MKNIHNVKKQVNEVLQHKDATSGVIHIFHKHILESFLTSPFVSAERKQKLQFY